MAVETVFARNTITGQEREFTKMVWDNIIDSTDEKGQVVHKSGWVSASRPEAKPLAAVEAENARKEAEAKAAQDQKAREAAAAKLIGEVEAKIIQGVSDKFDYKTEIRPYLDAKGWTQEIGGMPLKETVSEIRKRLIK